MRKGASVILMFALMLSMWISVAVAAGEEITAQEKFDELKTKNIFTGFPDGSAGLDQQMTRAQFAAVVYRIMLEKQLAKQQKHAEFAQVDVDKGQRNPELSDGMSDRPEGNARTSPSFRDVPDTHWAYEVVEAVYEAGFFQGVGNDRFDPDRNVTIQELATAYVRVIALTTDPDAAVEGAADWAGPSVRAAIDAGLIDADASFQEPALRSDLVNASYEVNAIVEPVLELVLSMEEGFSVAAINDREVRITTGDGRTFDSPVYDSDDHNFDTPIYEFEYMVWAVAIDNIVTEVSRPATEDDRPIPPEYDNITPMDSWNVRVSLKDGSFLDTFILGEVRDDGSFVLESSERFNEVTGAVSLDDVSLVLVTVSLYTTAPSADGLKKAKAKAKMANAYKMAQELGGI